LEPPIDASCGFDCGAQASYGLLVDRCFEYSGTSSKATPPDLGAWVRPLETLEGGQKVLPVEYRQSGQILMTDYFQVKEGSLFLLRRTFLPGQSVTWKGAQGEIVGVKWLWADALPGESHNTASSATLLGIGSGGTVNSTFKVFLDTPTANELTTPLSNYASGLKLLLSETPDHGVDSRRIFVEGLGFVQLNSAFSPTPGAVPLSYVLQKVRDVNPGDEDCGLGSP
jgi:hypothetical protein